MSYNTEIYPYDIVVRITDTIAGLSYIASGVLISPDEVLTRLIQRMAGIRWRV